MTYDYNLEEIKENLTLEQVADIVAELGGEPRPQGEALICKTICHGGEHHKLWYWDNTHLFRCFTDCGETFDIFELVRKVKSLELGIDYLLPQAVQYVADYFGISANVFEEKTQTEIDDYLDNLSSYDRIKDINIETKTVELKTYDGSFLKNLPKVVITPWIEDNISQNAMDRFEIGFEPRNQAIVIPHKDINGNIVGIRQRTLVKEDAERFGKYLPLKIGKQMFNHPLSFNLYGLYQNKENIKRAKKAIIFESEKSVLQLDSILGADNNIGVACCGSSVIAYQIQLLLSLGVEEVIIALDRQYKELGDNEHKKLVKNLTNIDKKYGNYVKITFMFDLGNLLPYKASPSDCGKDIFMQLFRERRNLY